MSVHPPATIGMLGGGQLGRYAVLAARELGYRCVVLDPDPHAPAGQVAHEHVVAGFDDVEAARRLGAVCDIVTTEFENPPAAVLAELSEFTEVRPAPGAVAIAQDRRAEKRFLAEHAIPVGPWVAIDGAADLPAATAAVRFPARLKTAREGYDGKGQRAVAEPDGLAAAWHDLGAVPCVLEQELDLRAELSVIVARHPDGPSETYPLMRNHHEHGVLAWTAVPGELPLDWGHEARGLAERIAEGLEYVGVLAVEWFVAAEHGLLVNELAPRPHNSGHWTLDAAVTSQFEQQVRAVCGLPLGSTAMTAPAAAMVNLFGDLWNDGEPPWAVALEHPAARLHLYGKVEPRPGRKMGHLTVVGDDVEDCRAQALALLGRLHARV